MNKREWRAYLRYASGRDCLPWLVSPYLVTAYGLVRRDERVMDEPCDPPSPGRLAQIVEWLARAAFPNPRHRVTISPTPDADVVVFWNWTASGREVRQVGRAHTLRGMPKTPRGLGIHAALAPSLLSPEPASLSRMRIRRGMWAVVAHGKDGEIQAIAMPTYLLPPPVRESGGKS